MFGGPWDSTLIMMGVPSLKMGVPSFYISVEFWEVVNLSVKGFEQALAVKQVSINIRSFSHLNHLQRPSQLDRNFRSFWGAVFFFRRFGLI